MFVARGRERKQGSQKKGSAGFEHAEMILLLRFERPDGGGLVPLAGSWIPGKMLNLRLRAATTLVNEPVQEYSEGCRCEHAGRACRGDRPPALGCSRSSDR